MDLPEYLRAVFGDVADDQVIGVVQRPQDGRGFITKPYNGRSRLKPDVAAYVCISTLKKPAEGQYLQRLMANAVRTYVIVLDDIGTKILEALFKGKLIPHYIIETSPGNFQYGYLVDLDPKQAQVLIEAFIEAGYSDPGARDVHRLVRVPGSLNFKTNPPFAARLVEANWDMPRYTFEELVEDFGLKPREPTSLRAASKPWDGDTQGDVIFQWLVEQGMVLSEPNPEGWAFVECPWAHEHTDGRTDSKYQVGHGATGKWMCFHGACAERHTKDFVLWCRETGAPDFDEKVVEQAVHSLGRKLTKFKEVLPVDPPPGASAGDILTAMVVKYAGRLKKQDMPSLELTKNGEPRGEQRALAENVQYIVEQCEFAVLRNHLTGEVELTHGDNAFAGLKNADERAALTRELMISLGQRMGMPLRGTLSELLNALAGNNGYHPVLNWVRAKEWDGIDRLRPLLDTIKTTNFLWRDIVVKRWCLQCIAAWTNWERETPISIPHLLVLVGPQGCGKSSWFGALLPATWRLLEQGAHLGHAGSKDDERRLTSAAITELAELESIIGRIEAGAFKSFLSRPIDKIRLPYDRHITVRPRCTSLCGSVNDAQFLNDPTGARRFWPLEVTSCDFTHDIDMQQFWAQMLAMFNSGERWNLNAEEMVQHTGIVEEHRVVSNAEGRLEELQVRMQHVPRAEWTFCTPSEVCRYYGLDNNYSNSRNAGGYLRKTFGARISNNGRKGWHVPLKRNELLGGYSPYIPPGDIQ